MKPLAKCANGCDASPAKPSKVLCAECLRKLGEKIRRLAKKGIWVGKKLKGEAMSKHTPGPWRWVACMNSRPSKPLEDVTEDDERYVNHYIIQGACHTPEKTWEYIIDDGSAGGEYGGLDPRSPDAHLIAAAPELLEAAKAALLEAGNERILMGGEYHRLKEAVAKAEGGGKWCRACDGKGYSITHQKDRATCEACQGTGKAEGGES